VQSLLHQEIARLPKAFHEVFVLCCLEEQSGAEAARQLGVKEGTVSSRLTKARQLLRRRLARRGVDLSAVLAALALWEGQASASISLASRTARAVIVAVTDNPAASGAISAGAAALAEGVNAAMIRTQGKVFTFLLLTAGLSAGIVGLGLAARPPATAREAVPPAVPQAAAARNPTTDKDDSATLVLSGRGQDPAGKAVRGAKLYVLDYSAVKAAPRVQAISDVDGRFRFRIPRQYVQLPPDYGNRWDHVFLCAMAKGHGPALCRLGKPESPGELTLHLAKDDMPIRGRVLDLQGKPVAGAAVRVIGLRLPNKGDLTAFAAALKTSKDGGYTVEYNFLIPLDNPGIAPLFAAASTDAAGRFQLRGIGRERIAVVEISGPTIESRQARVMTRPGERIQLPEWRESPNGGTFLYYGASFDHVAAPTTPIIGVVRDKDTHKPLAGAIVTSWVLAGDNLNARTFIRTTADQEGRYRLTGMPRGKGNRICIIGPEGESYLEAKKDVPAAQGLETVTVDAELKRGVWIKGRVIDKSTGKPVFANVEYFAYRDNPYRKDAPGLWPRLVTKEDGTFEFVGLPGRAVLTAAAYSQEYLVNVGTDKFKRNAFGQLADSSGQSLTDPPCGGGHTLMVIEPAKDAASLTCEIVLDPGRRLRGIIVGPDSKPLSGVRMGGALTGTPMWEHKTRPMAEFTVYGLKDGELRNVLALHEEKHLAGSLLLKGDEKGPLTLKLQPWGAITGRLVTGDGQPLPDAEVTLERYGDRVTDPLAGYHRTRFFQTDKDGKFRIEAFVSGLKYTMRAMSKGRLVGTVFEDLKVKSGETKDLGDVQAKE
jgi:protocatechuate 3,4-dioxygenase beta subunit